MEAKNSHTTVKDGALIDRFNRTLSYLRISVTDKCNLRCVYCVTGGPFPRLRQGDILSYEEILRIVRMGAGLGINKVRITGGEPLVRRGITDFLHRLTAVPGLSDVSLTTNGMLLGPLLPEIRNAGIKRLNISLDSLKRERFHEITGEDGLERVKDAIFKAAGMGFSPLKVNVVVIPDVNEDELTDFAQLTLSYPFHVRFIEYMPIGSPAGRMGRRLLTRDIKARIETLGALEPVNRGVFDGPARRFRLPGAPGEIGFISPVSHHFCHTCNRLRLTANGRLRLCLLSDQALDVGRVLRNGGTDEDLAALFRQAAIMKQEKHSLNPEGKSRDTIRDIMSSIGG